MRFIMVLSGSILLAACTAFPPFAGIEGASTIITDKTLTDHVVSYTTGKNCSAVRVKRGQTYCEEDELNPKTALFCYRTIANVTCYDRPDPYHGRQRKVDENEHNFPAKPLVPDVSKGLF